MSLTKIKSNAKINLSLGVLGKLNSKFHKIESFISFIDLCDDIQINQISEKNHKVFFYGKFSKNIPKNNTIATLLKILDSKKLLKDKKYLIKINKKIPLESGMGGGSMNAASILKYFLKKKIIKLNRKRINKIANQIGSDVILGLEKKNSILKGNGQILRSKTKLNLYLLIIKPNFGCSTKNIYKGVKTYSKPALFNSHKKTFYLNNLLNLKNDLEQPAFNKYKELNEIKRTMLNLPKVLFVRMTGSGSSIIGYFKSKKTTINAAKLLKKKYRNYWYNISKTI